MAAKCPKCGAVFEYHQGLSLIHMGSLKYVKCPACGKHSMMDTASKETVTWPEAVRPPEKQPGDL